MLKNEFNRLVARDSVPHGSICEWCDKPAEHQLIAVGGTRHNTEGVFCCLCSNQFLQAVIQSSSNDLGEKGGIQWHQAIRDLN
jgi:hypothetical protein